MTRVVFFDLDGTLVDTAPDLALALNMQRQRHGLAALPLAAIRPYASHGTRGLLEVGFDLTPGDEAFAAMRDEYLTLYDEVFTRAPVLFDGMAVVLDRLDEAGIPWGVVTNKPKRFTRPLMAAMRLDKRAVAIVSGDDAARPKPYPDSLLLACSTAGIQPAQCLYVGDAERDVQAGKAAGMHTIVARYGYIDAGEMPEQWGAEDSIDCPEELLRLVM